MQSSMNGGFNQSSCLIAQMCAYIIICIKEVVGERWLAISRKLVLPFPYLHNLPLHKGTCDIYFHPGVGLGSIAKGEL